MLLRLPSSGTDSLRVMESGSPALSLLSLLSFSTTHRVVTAGSRDFPQSHRGPGGVTVMQTPSTRFLLDVRNETRSELEGEMFILRWS